MNDDKFKHVGDEFVEETEEESEKEKELKAVYDLILPPGVSHKIIMEVVEKLNLEVATRKYALKTIDVEAENLLVLRGELDAVNNAHDYIYKILREKYGQRGQQA